MLITMAVRSTLVAITVILIVPYLPACRDGGGEVRTLTGDEIRRQFSDKTLRGTHHRKGYTFHSYWDANGTFRSYQNGSKTPRNGRWWIRGDDLICVEWQDTPGETLCRNIVVDNGGTYYKELIKSKGRRIRIITFHSFVDGNPDGL